LIISDDYSTYVINRATPKVSKIVNLLPQKHFLHRWVNHSINFVDPLDATIHTNTIERMWQDLRPGIRSKKHLYHIYEYINEFMFYRYFEDRERFERIIELLRRDFFNV